MARAITLQQTTDGWEWTCPHCKSEEYEEHEQAIDSELTCQNCFHSFYVGKIKPAVS